MRQENVNLFLLKQKKEEIIEFHSLKLINNKMIILKIFLFNNIIMNIFFLIAKIHIKFFFHLYVFLFGISKNEINYTPDNDLMLY